MATFLKYDKPLLCAMILCSTPDECIQKIRASIEDGAEAFGIQLCRLKMEYRTKEELERIFAACEGKPIYITSYRGGESNSCTDEECAELLLLGLEAGATLCDITGDLFEKGAPYQITSDSAAIEKQKALADEIHRRGGEVLVSSHTGRITSAKENLMIAKKQIALGADVVKIVSLSDSEKEIPMYIESIQSILALPEMDGRGLLFLASGKARVIREIGANFGVCMYLCLQNRGQFDSLDQPLLRKIKAVRDNIRFE